jgi:tetratricopeptide (TPR) repeat protein
LSYVVLGVVTIAALLSAIGVRKRHGHLNAGGAIVVVRGAGNRLLPAATSERVEAGVLAAVADSRLLEVHLHGVSVPEDPSELARRAGVRYGIVVTVTNSSSGRSNLGDSTFVHGDLVDADSGTVVASTEMISLASATADDARKLRSSVRAMLARRLDRRFATWAYASNAPRTYDAVLELGDGIDAFVQGDVGAAQRHFRASASLDTLSATPLVWSAFASTKYANRAAADSTAHELRASVRQLRPFDVAMLDYVDHAFGGDLVAILQSSQLLADVVPASEWRFLVASNAISLLRTHEAIRVLRDIGPNRGWMRKWFGYWGLLTTALHLQGDYAEELRVAEEARRDLPDDRRMLQLEVRALAALGRDRDVEQRCAEAVRYRQRPDWVEEQPMLQAVWELVAHGHRDAALRLLNGEERAYREAPDSARSALAGPLGDLRLALGRGREARALLEPLLRQGRPTVWDLGDVAVAAALMGDQRAADSIATIISREYGQSEDGIAGFQFAQIAAARGDRTQAINLLRAAFRSGFRFPTAVHLSGFGLFWNDPALRAVMRAPDDDR